MRQGLAIVTLLLVPSVGASGLQIEAFAYDLEGSGEDDAVEIRNVSEHEFRLGDVMLSDGEGVLAFPRDAVLPARGSIVVATRASSYKEASGRVPDFALQGLDGARTMRVLDPGFDLAHRADDLRVLGNGIVLDAVVYGQGEALAMDGWRGRPVNNSGPAYLRSIERLDATDTDTAQDWDEWSRRVLGADRPPPRFFEDVWAHGYTAPESSRAAVESFVALARQQLLLNVYQFRELGIVEAIARQRAMFPALQVKILLEPYPVGESAEELSERAHVIASVRRVGAEVHFASNARYAYNHAKYLVADGAHVLVQTENLVPTGIPASGRDGNRGFGVYAYSQDLAQALATVFDEDFRIEPNGARQADLAPPRFARPVLSTQRGSSGLDLRNVSQAEAWLLVTPHRPHADDPIMRAIRHASQEIVVAQLNLPPVWDTAVGRVDNPYLVALQEAAGRGVHVRILLDGHFRSDDGRPDNEDTVMGLAGSTGRLQARVQSGDAVLHAKMMIIDREWVLVGSMNWNANSVLNNREVSLFVHDPIIAGRFATAFGSDWSAAGLGHHVPAVELDVLALVVGAAALARRPRGA